MVKGLPYRQSAHDPAKSIHLDCTCYFVSAGARLTVSTARVKSEAASGNGSSPGAVRDSIQATVSLVTHPKMAWGASVFFRSEELGSDADMVQPGGILLMPTKAKLFVALAIIPGLVMLSLGVSHWESADPLRFTIYLLLALVASTLKVRLPGLTGTMSLNFLFILMGVSQLSFSETLALGAIATVTQCVWSSKSRPSVPQVLFNISALTMAITSAHFMYHLPQIQQVNGRMPVLLALAACFFFLTNTVLVATVLSLVETKPFTQIWHQCYIWSFPYYLIGAGVAGMVTYSSQYVGWRTALLILPIMYLIYLHYRLYVERQTTHSSIEI